MSVRVCRPGLSGFGIIRTGREKEAVSESLEGLSEKLMMDESRRDEVFDN